MTRANPTSRATRWHGLHAGVAAVWLLGSAGAAPAAIPEPEHRVYGRVTEDGEAVSDAEVALHRDGCDSELLASALPGELAEAPDFYVLAIPLEHPTGGEPPSEGTALVGDVATLCVTADDESGMPHTTALQQIHVGDRGLAVRFDVELAIAAAAGPDGPDSDGDGVPDFADNCAQANAAQEDANGNGIGDACEALVNRPVDDALVAVDDPTNPADSNGLGAVDYAFHVGGLEVTNAQYAGFLSAVASDSDPHGLYNPLMASDPRGGIVRSGAPGSRSYALKPNMGDKPVNFVSWFDAAAFANWIHNGEPAGSAAAALTGAFDLTVDDPGRNATLQESGWSLPTEQEWYKAAYHDPQRAGSPYWLYPLRDDADPLPLSVGALGDGQNPGPSVANYDGGADWNGQDGNVATVGSAGSTSFYGLFDMAGNVAEWLSDDADAQGFRRIRGGSYQDGISALASSAGDDDVLRDPGYEGPDVGMRVLVVPEPDTVLLAAAALVALAWSRARRTS